MFCLFCCDFAFYSFTFVCFCCRVVVIIVDFLLTLALGSCCGQPTNRPLMLDTIYSRICHDYPKLTLTRTAHIDPKVALVSHSNMCCCLVDVSCSVCCAWIGGHIIGCS